MCMPGTIYLLQYDTNIIQIKMKLTQGLYYAHDFKQIKFLLEKHFLIKA
jgi:hypothetical protein